MPNYKKLRQQALDDAIRRVAERAAYLLENGLHSSANIVLDALDRLVQARKEIDS